MEMDFKYYIYIFYKMGINYRVLKDLVFVSYIIVYRYINIYMN